MFSSDPAHQLGEEFFKPKIVEPELVDEWPERMAPDAFTGLAGDFVRLMAPHTESDSHALLGTFLISAGVLFGRQAWCQAEARKHYPVEFLLMIGNSSTSRKGSALARTESVLNHVDESFHKKKLTGFSSGEGLIEAMDKEKKDAKKDEGFGPVIDTSTPEVRSFLGVLEEFGSLLGVMKREGNIMSAIIRNAWDATRLRIMVRHNPVDVDDVNLSLIGHITSTELLNGLTTTDRMNGFANRWLPMCVRRSKYLPEGGSEPDGTLKIVKGLHDAVETAKGVGLIRRDEGAKTLWGNEYMRLTMDRPGLFGSLCSRAEAHTLRLSLLYALLDSSNIIRVDHLRAALAFWDYCERSAQHIFGAVTGDREGDKILNALARGPLSLRDFHRVFSNNRTGDWISAKLAELVRLGRITPTIMAGPRGEQVPGWCLK